MKTNRVVDMAQSNAVQDQPSMEDILTSIRRIIDDSNTKALNTSVPGTEEVANDDSVGSAPSPQQQVSNAGADKPAKSQIDEIPELDSFLEALDAKYSAQQQSPETADSNKLGKAEQASSAKDAVQANKEKTASVDSSIAMIDKAMNANNGSERDNSKYEARFSEDDRTAFAAVGNVLAANTAAGEKPDNTDGIARLKTNQNPKALVSEPSRARVGGSLNNLSEALAQEAQRQLPAMTESILKPMLADWLDNNLPSMVERLVREEIERIARGD